LIDIQLSSKLWMGAWDPLQASPPTGRYFLGFNRAKHAVVEAAILATRIAILPLAEIEAELKKLAVIVAKTGGKQEHAAFELLQEHVRHAGVHQHDRLTPL
jgi:hypothetical protein